MQKRNTGSIQKNQDGLLLQRKPLVQARTNRNHPLLPSDFHEQLSDAGKSYWNQLPYEEQNKLIQQCRMPMNEMPGVKAELSSQSGDWNKRLSYSGAWSKQSAQHGDWSRQSVQVNSWTHRPFGDKEHSAETSSLPYQQYEPDISQGKYSGERESYKHASTPRLIKYRRQKVVLQESVTPKILPGETFTVSNQHEIEKYKTRLHNEKTPVVSSIRKWNRDVLIKDFIKRDSPRIVPKPYQFYRVQNGKSGSDKIPVRLSNKTARQWKRLVPRQKYLLREELVSYKKKTYGTNQHSAYSRPRYHVKSARYKMNQAQLVIRSFKWNDLRRYVYYRDGSRKRIQESAKSVYRLPVRSRCRKKRKSLSVLSVILTKGRTFRPSGKHQKISELYYYQPGYNRFRRYVLRYERNRVFRQAKNLVSNRYRLGQGNTSRKNPYPERPSWKRKRNQNAKRKAVIDKKKNRLDKKQMKRLIKKIEYLAALSGAVREKESNPTQELKTASLLVTPISKVTIRAIFNFVKSSSVVSMITGNLAQIISGMITAFSAALSSTIIPLLTVMVPVVMALSLLACLIPTFNLTGGYSGNASQYDAFCYLTAKYESGGDAASVGEDVGYLAYGEFQFYYMYELRPFIRWCYEKNPTLYQPFEAYLNMDVNQIPGEDFRNAWKQMAEKDYSTFELDQEEYICTYTLNPTLTNLKEKYGYDFENASAALKACVLSFANRSGKSVATLSRYFDGTTASSTDEEIINRAYAAMYAQRPIRRWDREHEWKDCLDQLAGTLDIYAKSENGAGGIDWSWKKSAPGRILDSTGDDIVDYALQFVGNPYVWGGDSLTGGIDCSHFIWRVLLNTGHYSGGYLTSGDWRNVGEPVASIDQAIAGDVVCYEGHVAFYDGNGYLVEAKNTREGITHDEKPDYMPIVCIRRIR